MEEVLKLKKATYHLMDVHDQQAYFFIWCTSICICYQFLHFTTDWICDKFCDEPHL